MLIGFNRTLLNSANDFMQHPAGIGLHFSLQIPLKWPFAFWHPIEQGFMFICYTLTLRQKKPVNSRHLVYQS